MTLSSKYGLSFPPKQQAGHFVRPLLNETTTPVDFRGYMESDFACEAESYYEEKNNNMSL